MSKYEYSKAEQQLSNVLNYQAAELKNIQRPDMSAVENRISESEKLLSSLGYPLNNISKILCEEPRKMLSVPTWEDLCAEAVRTAGNSTTLESLFTDEELRNNELAIKMLDEEYNAVIDILLVGIPQKTSDGLKAGPLSNYVRSWFDKKFPEEEMEKLANSKVSKVPYDAQDNRNTIEYINGLSAYYHRLLSLGHDPLLGLIFGVFDIMTGRMTTIDKTGKVVSQIMENYADRREQDIFAALAKQIIHFKSDITTSMGLPAPLMGLFNLLQFGNIGETEETIAEIVQGMYYEGYDFIHFCSMSIPAMIIEVVVRVGYAFKRIEEGYSIKESIPFSLSREKHPKLSTMLFIGHSLETAVNAGKIYFTKNPMVIEKPELRDLYVCGKINEELIDVYDEINITFKEYSEKYVVVL